MVKGAGDYKWSSYASHALGIDEETRRAAYQTLFLHQVDEETLTGIREAVNRGNALGSERFKDEIEAALARSVRPGTVGRPRKLQDGVVKTM